MSSIKKSFSVVVLFTCFISLIYSNLAIGDGANKRKGDWCSEANLSDVQKESVREKWKNFKVQAESLSEADRKQAKQELRQSILDTVLESDEQRTALSACWEKWEQKRRNWCSEANLSDAQRKSIREMRRNFKAQAGDLSEADRKQAKQELRQSILDTVLESDEQRTALSACWEKWEQKRRNWCSEANLSDAQRKSIREMRRNFKAQAGDLSEADRKQAKQELRQNILDNVLESDEQRTALSACWEKRKRHRRNKRKH